MTVYQPDSFPTYRKRLCAVPIVLAALVCAIALFGHTGTGAQPLCPFDSIWDADAEACVPLEPTPTATATATAPAEPTTPPAPGTPEAPEDPGIDDVLPDGTEVSDDSGMTAPPEDGAATPGAEFGPLVDLLRDLFTASFDAPPQSRGIYVLERVCDHVVDPADSLESIKARCRAMPDDRKDIAYDLSFNGMYAAYLPPSPGGYQAWIGYFPGGEVRIAARYNLFTERYQAPFVACVRYSGEESDEPLTHTIMPTQLSSDGTLTIPDLPEGGRLYCMFHYLPNLETTVTVDLIAYMCPQRVADENIVTYSELILLCGWPGPDEVEMQVSSSGGVTTRFSHLGLASFQEVPPGDIQVREFVPPGYGVPLVMCIVTGPEGQTIKQRDIEIFGDGYRVPVRDIPPGSSVLCEFFNIPGETPDYGGPPATWRRDVG